MLEALNLIVMDATTKTSYFNKKRATGWTFWYQSTLVRNVVNSNLFLKCSLYS